jgi:hypothetical protein
VGAGGGGGGLAATPGQCLRSHCANAPTHAGCSPSCNWHCRGVGRGGCPPFGEGGGDGNIDDIDNNNEEELS